MAQYKNWKPLSYFVYDSALGNNAGVQLASQLGLHLISKLRFVWECEYAVKGRRKKYGDRVQERNLSARYLKQTKTEDGILTKIYQFPAHNKKIADKLNVVAMVKTNLVNQKTAHVLLFSSDMSLSHDKLIDYYSSQPTRVWS